VRLRARTNWWTAAIAIAALWTVFGILFAGQIYVREYGPTRAGSRRDVFNIVYFYWAWAVVTPIVLATARYAANPALA
jgi:hypothetical protein